MRSSILAIASVMAIAGVFAILSDVGEMAAGEKDIAADAPLARLEEGQTLVMAPLAEGQSALFELCVADADFDAWSHRTVDVYFLSPDAPPDLARRVVLEETARQVRHSGSTFCVTALQWDEVLVPGEYAVGVGQLGDSEAASDHVRLRIVAWRQPSAWGKRGVIALVLGLFLLLLVLLWPAPNTLTPEEEELQAARFEGRRLIPMPAGARATSAIVLFFFLTTALGAFASSAVQVAFLMGVAQALLLISLVFLWSNPKRDESRAESLGWVPLAGGSGRAALMIAAVAISGLVLYRLGALAAGLVPSTGISPIEAFVSAPSGSLAVALVAIVAPIAEELLFRGLVYGVLERRFGATWALVGSTVLFALVHLPQQWGAWGAFLSVSISGFGFGLVRRFTGSSTASGLAHFTHNATISLIAAIL